MADFGSEYTVTVRCNCGLTHPSIEDWQRCPNALTPRNLEPWWREPLLLEASIRFANSVTAELLPSIPITSKPITS